MNPSQSDSTYTAEKTPKLKRLSRTMAVLVVIVCLSPVLIIHFRTQAQRELLSRIEKSTVYAELTPRHPLILRDWFRRLLGESWLKGYDRIDSITTTGPQGVDDELLSEIAKIHHLKSLRFHSSSRVTSDGLQPLTEHVELEYLHFSEDFIDSEKLRAIGQIDSLIRLSLSNTNLTDEGLSHLSGLTSLKYLTVAESTITDEGVDLIVSMPSLSELRLGKSTITNEGLQRLKRLPNLSKLALESENLTDEAIQKFHKSLPGCELYINGEWY